jgi:hypothetical protein
MNLRIKLRFVLRQQNFFFSKKGTRHLLKFKTFKNVFMNILNLCSVLRYVLTPWIDLTHNRVSYDHVNVAETSFRPFLTQ